VAASTRTGCWHGGPATAADARILVPDWRYRPGFGVRQMMRDWLSEQRPLA